VTTRADVHSWLSARRPAPSDHFAAHVAASACDGDGDLPALLARTGMTLLARVTAEPVAGRALALDLLAADAYVTYAFEAQAEQDVDRLLALAERLSRGGDLA
jgi:hypothetical protein